jgi:hypothetical protein
MLPLRTPLPRVFFRRLGAHMARSARERADRQRRMPQVAAVGQRHLRLATATERANIQRSSPSPRPDSRRPGLYRAGPSAVLARPRLLHPHRRSNVDLPSRRRSSGRAIAGGPLEFAGAWPVHEIGRPGLGGPSSRPRSFPSWGTASQRMAAVPSTIPPRLRPSAVSMRGHASLGRLAALPGRV